MALRTWDELRKVAIEETPEQWCITLECLEYDLEEHGFSDLKTFITTPYSKGGLGIPLEKAVQFINYNPVYEHKAKVFMDKLGLIDTAKNTPVLNDSAGNPHKSNCDKSKNITIKREGGTSQSYRISKLKRDFPEIAERLCDEGLIDTAKNAGVLNDNGVRKYESTCDKSKNGTSKRGSNSASYRIAKLKRDHSTQF